MENWLKVEKSEKPYTWSILKTECPDWIKKYLELWKTKN